MRIENSFLVMSLFRLDGAVTHVKKSGKHPEFHYPCMFMKQPSVMYSLNEHPLLTRGSSHCYTRTWPLRNAITFPIYMQYLAQ